MPPHRPPPPAVSRPSLAYFAACSAGLGLGAARTYYDLMDLGVPFRVLGDLAAGGAARAATAAGAGAAAAGAAPRLASSGPLPAPVAALAPPASWAARALAALCAAPGLVSDARLIASRMLQSELGLFVALNWLVSVYCLAAMLTTVRRRDAAARSCKAEGAEPTPSRWRLDDGSGARALPPHPAPPQPRPPAPPLNSARSWARCRRARPAA
jgi:hypothetical protein